MYEQTMCAFGVTVRDLDRELIARGAYLLPEQGFDFTDEAGTPQRVKIFRQVETLYRNAPPLNPVFGDFSTQELLQKLGLSIKESRLDGVRGTWFSPDRKDRYEISDAGVSKNLLSVAAVCKKEALVESGSGHWKLKVKPYGETFNLCPCESFFDQPAAAYALCSGVLVGEDTVVTAAHFAGEDNVGELRFFFGYEMSDPVTANTVFPEESLYRGVEIVRRKYDVKGPGAGGSDFALVKLDRRVKGREIVCVSDRSVFYEQPVYVLGFPCGLPVKYAPGPVVESVGKAYFMACMDVYSGNSGSPVFDAESHELVGIVSRADCRDFRWLGDCVVSIIYPNSKIHSEGSRCTRVGEFKSYMSLKS